MINSALTLSLLVFNLNLAAYGQDEFDRARDEPVREQQEHGHDGDHDENDDGRRDGLLARRPGDFHRLLTDLAGETCQIFRHLL